jgi:hypothetical protein
MMSPNDSLNARAGSPESAVRGNLTSCPVLQIVRGPICSAIRNLTSCPVLQIVRGPICSAIQATSC